MPPTRTEQLQLTSAKDDRVRRFGVAAVVLLVLYAAGALLGQLDALRTLELSTIDWRMRRSPGEFSRESSPIVIVDIDDESYEGLHAVWPWSRSYYARAIHNLNRAGARLILVDILLDKRNTDYPGGDDSLVQVLQQYDNVILAGKTLYPESMFSRHREFVQSWGTQKPETVFPHTQFLAADSSNWGIVDVDEDLDNVVRTYYTKRAVTDSSPPYPTLAIRAFERLTGDTMPWESIERSFRIAYPGDARTFAYRPFYQVVDDSTFWTRDEEEWGEENNWFDTLNHQGIFDDKIVLIGASVEELHDVKLTPFSSRAGHEVVLTPGVEVHAAALHTLLEGLRIREARRGPAYLVLLLVCIALFAVGATARNWAYLLVVGAAATLWWFVAFGVYDARMIIVPIVQPLVSIAVVTAGQLAYLFYLEQIRRRQVTGMFGHYVPKQVVRQLVRDPSMAKLGGERRELTVLFCDIEGFTTICENLPPERVVDLLNEYLSEMTSIVLEAGGIIDKYEGDLIMAEFGIPFALEDHALRACRTAFLMQKRLHELRDKWLTEGKPLLKSRIGIGTGTMLFGNMGSTQAFDYTVMGDVVNLASRLEGANKGYGTRIMINELAAEQVREHMLVREMDLLIVKGRQQPETCYQLVAPADTPKAEQILTVAALFAEGLALYRAQKWDEAIATFEKVLEVWDDDEPSKVFIKRCRDFCSNPPPADWNGVFALTSK